MTDGNENYYPVMELLCQPLQMIYASPWPQRLHPASSDSFVDSIMSLITWDGLIEWQVSYLSEVEELPEAIQRMAAVDIVVAHWHGRSEDFPRRWVSDWFRGIGNFGEGRRKPFFVGEIAQMDSRFSWDNSTGRRKTDEGAAIVRDMLQNGFEMVFRYWGQWSLHDLAWNVAIGMHNISDNDRTQDIPFDAWFEGCLRGRPLGPIKEFDINVEELRMRRKQMFQRLLGNRRASHY